MHPRPLLFASLLLASWPLLLPAQTPKTLSLDELDLSSVTNGWKSPQAGRSVGGNALQAGSRQAARGLGVHAPSAATVSLDGQADRFTASVGVDDEATDSPGSVEFLVLGDGRELWRSGVMKKGDPAKPVDVPLAGIRTLVLQVTDGGDGVAGDHADWLDAAISYHGAAPAMKEPDGLVVVKAGPTTARFLVSRDGRLQQIAFGPVNSPAPEGGSPSYDAYPAWGDGFTSEAALEATHADGNTSTTLHFVDRKETPIAPGVRETRIALKDPLYPFDVTLVFRSYDAEGVLEQWTEIRHEEPGPVLLQKFASSSPLLGSGEYYLTHYYGTWANEMTPEEERLGHGLKTVQSAEGVRVHLGAAPSFLVSPGGPAREESGQVLAGTLAYSGNFQFQFETDFGRMLRVIAGMNPAASAYRLAPGETFTTPAMIWCWSDQGKGDIARRLARWGRQYGMRDGDRPRSILLNNWEATGFGFNEQKLDALIADTSALGMEMFLLDDGWFGKKYPRDWDGQGLGDWVTDTRKLPSGLAHLTAEAAKHGVRFGLWVEPEMVNPKSELFEQHPDWVIRQPGRDLLLSRSQLVLDLANPAVRDWIVQTLDRLLSDNPGISYIKWDCNRPINQPGSPWLKPGDQSRLPIDYQRGLYDVLDRIVQKHPGVEIMLCASGGGRVDYGSLRRGHEFWASDNTDPLSRVGIQWGYEQFFPQKAISAHVTHMGQRPLKFAFDVAMSARLGLDLDTPHLSADDREFTRQAIANYKSLRDLVQSGDLYRLEPPYGSARSALMNVAPDKARAVVFAWQLKDGSPAPLRLAGLDPQKTYRVEEINLRQDQPAQVRQNGQSLTGADLMAHGLDLTLARQYDSAVVTLTSLGK